MKFTKLNRTIHNWISIFIALPLLLVIISGLFLQLKKDVDWIQPPSKRGESPATPIVSHDELLRAATSVEPTKGMDWSDFERIDYKTDRGMIKFITADGWEVQVDRTNGLVLSVMERRSDLLEKIHDGTFFGDWVKYYIILPSAICLFILWITGIYMFVYPYVKRASNKRNKREKAAAKGV
ncbi:MAG: PepSY domain-containing protein [Alphaproteobacteria bacterium]|nr:PepSY domain-containing protein [Alphaproteobacteria bacterium]HPF46809.1 PepSY-associated TM helix domain-containing protein [Emcibacteraceae bacterium]